MASGEDRTVSEAVGFILIFSVNGIAFILYLCVGVLQQNRAAEFTP